MGRNIEKDTLEMAEKNQRILENGFRIFADNSIERITMNDVAKAAGIAISSLYRYYSTKPKLVIGIGTWAWEKYAAENAARESEMATTGRTAAEMFDFYLESFLDLYRHHKDLLRFNQYFNVYLQDENVSDEEKKPYMDMIQSLEDRFGMIYQKGLQDGTIRTDIQQQKIFSTTLHLMLAVVTRYAFGLVYNSDGNVEEELMVQKNMLLQQYTIRTGNAK